MVVRVKRVCVCEVGERQEDRHGQVLSWTIILGADTHVRAHTYAVLGKWKGAAAASTLAPPTMSPAPNPGVRSGYIWNFTTRNISYWLL